MCIIGTSVIRCILDIRPVPVPVILSSGVPYFRHKTVAGNSVIRGILDIRPVPVSVIQSSGVF